MAEEKRKTVKIACSITNGITLQLWQPGYDDGTGDGKKMPRKDGPAVRLNGPSALHTGAGATHRIDVPPGETEVDAEWWGKWKAQNVHNPYFEVGAIHEVEEEAAPLP
jgi:hypothetical protein